MEVEIEEIYSKQIEKLSLAIELIRLKHLIPKEHRRFSTVPFCRRVLDDELSLDELKAMHKKMLANEQNGMTESKLPITDQSYIMPPKCKEPRGYQPEVDSKNNPPSAENVLHKKSDRWVTHEQIDDFLKIASDLTSVLYRMEKKMIDRNKGPFDIGSK